VNYYNEFNPAAAAWLRELISLGVIPDGHVDTRSITEVKAHEIKDYTQCHFFAGIGGWSHALKLAGWPATRPVWTGSCACQPFSSAGKGLGTADVRHLWPVLFRLIAECRPECVFGEQVASAIGKGWLDGVCSDLETEGYACGAVVLGAHSAGAPHIRQRLFWVADASRGQREQFIGAQGNVLQRPAYHGATGRLDDAEQPRLEGQPRAEGGINQPRRLAQDATGPTKQAGDVSHWSTFTLIPCADGKARRIEPGSSPLVNGLPRGVVHSGDPRIEGYAQHTAEARVMRLHGYGNSIVPQTAAMFIAAAM
jgi:DNA (cytosine-5)-methyltransferase 1